MKGPPGLHMRDTLIEGIGPWMWQADDHWAWAHPAPEFPALRDLILAHVKGRGTIIQAGGCMGMYPRLWSESFKHVYTFEPDPVNFYCLVANCPSERIIKMQMALSDQPRLCAVEKVCTDNAGGHYIGDGQHVPVLCLDALSFPSIDAIQLDCEGHEPQIIDGAQATLRKHRPVVSIEAPSSILRATLHGLGYAEVGRCGTMPDVVFAAP